MDRDNLGRFVKGSTPHNKNKKQKDWLSPEGIEKVKTTQYKNGQTSGTKSKTWKGGVHTYTKDCVHLYAGINKRPIRRPRAVYEEHYGPIPKDFVIFHIDGDMHNDDIRNLEAISRSELVKRNKAKGTTTC